MQNLNQKIKELHDCYVIATGRELMINMHRERMWAEWLRWSDNKWDCNDLKKVIFYLRKKTREGSRNGGSLKFQNLIGSPDLFEEDLAQAQAEQSDYAKPRKTSSKGSISEQGKELATADETKSFLDDIQQIGKPKNY
jgi:hypothetical protein